MAECKFVGRPKDMYRDRDGKHWIVTFTTENRINGDVFDELAKVDCDIEFRKHRDIRSRNANAYFHVLVNKIAAETGESDEQVKVRLITSYGALARTTEGQYLMFLLPLDADATDYYKYAVLFDQREVNGKKVNMWKVYKDSHKMNSKEMAHLIDMTIQEARDLGIDTDTPEMKKRWADYEAAHPRKETEHGTQD
jgi:hypothetical protein